MRDTYPCHFTLSSSYQQIFPVLFYTDFSPQMLMLLIATIMSAHAIVATLFAPILLYSFSKAIDFFILSPGHHALLTAQHKQISASLLLLLSSKYEARAGPRWRFWLRCQRAAQRPPPANITISEHAGCANKCFMGSISIFSSR